MGYWSLLSGFSENLCESACTDVEEEHNGRTNRTELRSRRNIEDYGNVTNVIGRRFVEFVDVILKCDIAFYFLLSICLNVPPGVAQPNQANCKDAAAEHVPHKNDSALKSYRNSVHIYR